VGEMCQGFHNYMGIYKFWLGGAGRRPLRGDDSPLKYLFLIVNFCTKKCSTIPSEWVAAGFSLRVRTIAFLSSRNLKVAAT